MSLAYRGPVTKLCYSIYVQQSNSSPARFKDQFKEEWKDLGSAAEGWGREKKDESRIERDDSRPRQLASTQVDDLTSRVSRNPRILDSFSVMARAITGLDGVKRKSRSFNTFN